ncbi:aspartate aminotransferase family protein [Micromonospora sp. DT41]|uniref:aminotransferase family protein n=1 Tax=Micromonospora sp. DT41 TaxID=3393437 RepID=UPI003CE70B31
MTATTATSALVLPHGGPPGAHPARLLCDGAGVRVRDRAGRTYLDAAGGLDGVSLGHAHPELVDAAARQLRRLPAGPVGHRQASDAAYHLAERLAATVPGFDQVYLDSCDSAAVDTAVRFARYHHRAQGRPLRRRILAVEGALHGCTGFSAAASAQPAVSHGFADPDAGTVHLRRPPHRAAAGAAAVVAELVDELTAVIHELGPDTVAACVVEPVLTAAGALVPPADYLPAIRAVLARHDILLIADESVTGLRRTGPLTCTGVLDPPPDLLVLGPSLTSAHVPLAAVLVGPEVSASLVAGAAMIGGLGHGGPTAGHPLACAVADRALDILADPETGRRVAALADHLAGRLAGQADHPAVREIRQEGLLAAYVLHPGDRELPYDAVAHEAAELAAERGLLVRAYSSAVVLAPPLTVTESELDDMVARWDEALRALPAAPAAAESKGHW